MFRLETRCNLKRQIARVDSPRNSLLEKMLQAVAENPRPQVAAVEPALQRDTIVKAASAAA
jgi:hypothetical protein